MDFTGSPRVAVTVNGSVPAPTLRWREGDTVTVRVANRLRDETSVHWHGILLPANMDGVPGLSFDGIRPGETFVYRFRVRQGGTYWYHSHSAFQEQRGLYGALVIEPRDPEPFSYDRDHVVLLSDWTDENPARVLAKLKKQSDYYNYHRRTVGDFFRDARKRGFGATVSDRLAWGDMRMRPTGPGRRHRRHVHLFDERSRTGGELDGSLPSPASGSGSGSSTARRRATSTCAFRV